MGSFDDVMGETEFEIYRIKQAWSERTSEA